MTAGHTNLGVRCSEEGLFLAGAALIEKRGGGYRVRPTVDLERLLDRAYGGKFGVCHILPGLERTAAALNRQAMWLAVVEVASVALPELPNPIAALRLEIEDLLIAAEPLRKALLRAGWDPNQHPRTGTPPNPGWFAPAGNAATFQPAAASEEDERPEEALDPLVEVRQRIWQSGQATLRTIDPTNSQLQSLHGPDWAPSQADIDTLHTTIRNAEVRRILGRLMPNGKPVGIPGNSRRIRLLPGGIPQANELLDYLRVGGRLDRARGEIKIIELPGNLGLVVFRSESRSGGPAIDVPKIPGLTFRRIHFNKE